MIYESSPFTFHPKAEKCIYSYVMEAVEKFERETPDKKVLISAEDPNHFLTYSQLKQQITAVEAFLHKIGFKKGEVGATVMPNNIDIIPFYMAVVGRGGIFNGMIPSLTEFEIHRELSESGAQVVFTSKEQLEKVKGATSRIPWKTTVICLEDFEEADVNHWSSVIATEDIAPKHSNDIHQVAVLPFSSGTTGQRKGVKLSHYNIMTAALNIIRHTEEIMPKPKDSNGKEESVYSRVQLMSFPSYHISGKCCILAPLLSGATVVMLSQFDLRVYLETIQRYKVFNLLLSPLIILALCRDPLVSEYDISSVGYASCGGAPLNESLGREFVSKYPNVMLTQSYGMTECMFPFFVLCDRNDNFAPAGCVTPGYQAKIVDLETGRTMEKGGRGEVFVRGPSVMIEYHNKPEATREVLDEEGWFSTGDIGYFNERGELFVVDRRKDLMKINDQQVSPVEIECAIASDPRIKDVGVVGVSNEKRGQVPAAFIVKEDPTLTEEDVLLIIKERVADCKWAEGIIRFVESIPKLSSGKILRRQLRELL